MHHGALYADPNAPMDPAVRARVLVGRDAAAADYIRVLVDRPRLTAAFLERLEGFDAMVTPTATTTAPTLDALDERGTPARLTRLVNYLGLCALAVPTGLTAAGLPASLQIIARPHAEPVARRVGHVVEGLVPPLGTPPLAG